MNIARLGTRILFALLVGVGAVVLASSYIVPQYNLAAALLFGAAVALAGFVGL